MTCQDCEDDVPATQVIDVPWGNGQHHVCEAHYDAAGERGAVMWSTEDVGAGERYQDAAALDRRMK